MNKKTLVIIIAGLVGAPMVAAASTLENVTAVTGHTVYANMGGFDEDVAAIAGLAESKVVWFNGQTIFSTLGEGLVYAYPSGQCNPIAGGNYTFVDYSLSFRDPNNVTHIVAHYTYLCAQSSLIGDATTGDLESALGTLLDERRHVWVTLTHARILDNPLTLGDAGRIYNFALAVDTSMGWSDGDRDNVSHGGGGGRTSSEINEGDSLCAQEDDHVCNGGTVDGEDGPDLHDHNTAQVDLRFSRDDRGVGAATSSPPTTHPGTEAGCAADARCAAVTDPNGTYEDPTGAS